MLNDVQYMTTKANLNALLQAELVMHDTIASGADIYCVLLTNCGNKELLLLALSIEVSSERTADEGV
jgi:hypothetical protein